MIKTIKSVAYYLLHNIADVTYVRVLKAHLKYSNASLYELQHGVESAASKAYRGRHPEQLEEIHDAFDEFEETFAPDYVEEVRPPELRMFCYRDHLSGPYHRYKGINLYFAAYEEMDYFRKVQKHFRREFEVYFGGMTYEESDLSETDVGNADEADFMFDIGITKTTRIQYEGYWSNDDWVVLNMFGGFDVGQLEKMLIKR